MTSIVPRWSSGPRKQWGAKDAPTFKLIATLAERLDTPAEVNGTAVYRIDVRPPGVKIATLAQSPVFGGRVKSLDDTAAKAVKGVRQIVRSTTPSPWWRTTWGRPRRDWPP